MPFSWLISIHFLKRLVERILKIFPRLVINLPILITFSLDDVFKVVGRKLTLVTLGSLRVKEPNSGVGTWKGGGGGGGGSLTKGTGMFMNYPPKRWIFIAAVFILFNHNYFTPYLLNSCVQLVNFFLVCKVIFMSLKGFKFLNRRASW